MEPFGTLHLYGEKTRPAAVVLFISGDGGWNLGVVDMARRMASLDALVVGIDIRHYLRSLGKSAQTCLYPAADFESLSKFVQKSLGFPQYMQPVLAGYSSGATLAYAVIAQAPPNTFKGALSLGFCPDLPLARAPCRGSGLTWKKLAKKSVYIFQPAEHLSAPWVVLQGTIDQVCNAEQARGFVSKVPGSEIILLPRVGHGFSVPKHWLPQFRQAFLRLIAPRTAPVQVALHDLPLIEVPATPPVDAYLAVMVSGDGGWAGIDRQVSEYLAAHGVAVVGINALKYFWTARTPEEASRDLARVITCYLKKWQKEQVVLIGYSLGADVLPFMATRLPAKLHAKIRLLALLSPGRQAAFEFHLSDWIGGRETGPQYPIGPEFAKLGGLPKLCFYGAKEKETICRDPSGPSTVAIPLRGGHHFGGEYALIAERILKALGEP
jgi:type IV secretory pathway VirJ component